MKIRIKEDLWKGKESGGDEVWFFPHLFSVQACWTPMTWTTSLSCKKHKSYICYLKVWHLTLFWFSTLFMQIKEFIIQTSSERETYSMFPLQRAAENSDGLNIKSITAGWNPQETIFSLDLSFRKKKKSCHGVLEVFHQPEWSIRVKTCKLGKLKPRGTNCHLKEG